MDYQLQAHQVSKKFSKGLRYLMQYGTIDIAKQYLGFKLASDKLRKGEFWAVNNCSFHVNRGEVLGLVGANGSGKSTLLKLISGIYPPDHGYINYKGRIGSLISVGAGFHPMLTGRENIYVNGQILGMSKSEIDSHFDEIVDFAELYDFIDMPVKHYSSGMYVRLGFSIAAFSKPDILLVDEILAVGDVSFQNKCLTKMNELKQQSAVVFVSHNMNTVQLFCDRLAHVHEGRIIQEADSKTAIEGLIHKYEDRSLEARQHDMVHVAGCESDNNFIITFTFTKTFAENIGVAFALVNRENGISTRFESPFFKPQAGSTYRAVLKDRSLLPPSFYCRVSISKGEWLNRIVYIDRAFSHTMDTDEAANSHRVVMEWSSDSSG